MFSQLLCVSIGLNVDLSIVFFQVLTNFLTIAGSFCWLPLIYLFSFHSFGCSGENAVLQSQLVF